MFRNRIPENESVRLICKPRHFSENEILSVSTSQALGWFIPEEIKIPTQLNHLIIIVYCTNQDSGAKMLALIRNNCGLGKRHMSNYALQEDLRIFYARKFSGLFYHSESDNKTVIFADKIECKQFHALQMMIPKYFPSLFKDNPLTDSETELLKSLGDKSAVNYERLIEAFAKDLDIRSEIIRTKLAGFETVFERRRLDEIKGEILNHQSNYDNQLYTLRELAAKIQEKKYVLAGLECAIKKHSGNSELMEYFQCNKNLSIIKVIGTTIEFVSHGYADIFDEDAFEQYVGNHSGYFYSNLNPLIDKSQMEKLWRAIFSEGRYKLRLCASYSADIRTGLRPNQHYSFPQESRSYLPNPHIQEYGCIGNYAMRFQEYMQKRDYVGGIDQAVVSGRNLNFHDSVVISNFASTLSHTEITCIEKPDGNLITPLEAIKELEENSCPDQS